MAANANLVAALEGASSPERPFIESSGVAATYGDAFAHVRKIAGGLKALGLEPGDRVTAIGHKSVEQFFLYLGCLAGGYVYHPINPAYTTAEFAYFFENAEPSLIVADPALSDSVGEALDGRAVEVLSLDANGRGSATERWSSTAESAYAEVGPADFGALLYSSGTTGKPKGIPISHGALLANAKALVSSWGLQAADVLVHALPIYHVHGLFISMNSCMLANTQVRFLPKFDVELVLDALAGATVMMGVPTYYSRLLNAPRLSREAPGMRLFVSGSAPLTTPVFEAFERLTGHAILERYGMTETGIITSNPLNGERKAGTVGQPLAGVEVRVTNASVEEGGTQPVGDIEVRGASVFGAYWRLEDPTRDDFDDERWFKTGDQGYFDADNYLHIVGRAKDMVITGGLNVYPKEVEVVLDALPAVSESAVFGVPHADFGEAVVGVVVAGAGEHFEEAAAIKTLKSSLANYKIPKRLLVVDELPRNAMGKVEKAKLRGLHQGLFAAG